MIVKLHHENELVKCTSAGNKKKSKKCKAKNENQKERDKLTRLCCFCQEIFPNQYAWLH